jgi:3',5'-cyclic-AMP phosphodiesterase
MKVLQMTDTHLYGRADGQLRGVATYATVQSVLHNAMARAPDLAAMLVTGDLVQDDPDGYLRFRSVFAGLTVPVLCIPGNHDEPAAMRRELADPPFQIGGSFTASGWRIVMLDSFFAGHVGGRLSTAELARLEAELSATREHVMVCLHHHPIAMGGRWLDPIGLGNADDFWRVIDAHDHVRAIVWGHVHQDYVGARKGVKLFATPSTGAQFLPGSDTFAIDSKPPAYREFQLQADGRIDSAVHWVAPLASRRAQAR